MQAVKISAIPAFKDNYIWAISRAEKALIVDPGTVEPVLAFLRAQKESLGAILITHHHSDHVSGVQRLVDIFPNVPVYGPQQEEIPYLTHKVEEGIKLNMSDFPSIQVLSIPGHTKGHIAYLIEKALFCGDTLFSGGCGRVFDGSYEQLYASLQKIAALDPDTQIYCGHEYTLANLKFALHLEPKNSKIKMRVKQVEALRVKGLPSVPSSLSLEQETNPFLRLQAQELEQTLLQHLGFLPKNTFEIFKALRLWKNEFT